MSFRYRRRLRILPGLWVNLSRSGVSASVGIRGLTVNLSEAGAQTTVVLPGSGLSYRARRRPRRAPRGASAASGVATAPQWRHVRAAAAIIVALAGLILLALGLVQR